MQLAFRRWKSPNFWLAVPPAVEVPHPLDCMGYHLYHGINRASVWVIVIVSSSCAL
jgi:hypothetical protein